MAQGCGFVVIDAVMDRQWNLSKPFGKSNPSGSVIDGISSQDHQRANAIPCHICGQFTQRRCLVPRILLDGFDVTNRTTDIAELLIKQVC